MNIFLFFIEIRLCTVLKKNNHLITFIQASSYKCFAFTASQKVKLSYDRITSNLKGSRAVSTCINKLEFIKSIIYAINSVLLACHILGKKATAITTIAIREAGVSMRSSVPNWGHTHWTETPWTIIALLSYWEV